MSNEHNRTNPDLFKRSKHRHSSVPSLSPLKRTEFYWFEVAECGRRLLLASVIGVVAEDSAAAPTMGLLICFGFLWVFTKLEPFKDDGDSMLGVVLAYSLALLFLAALLLKVNAHTAATCTLPRGA